MIKSFLFSACAHAINCIIKYINPETAHIFLPCLHLNQCHYANGEKMHENMHSTENAAQVFHANHRQLQNMDIIVARLHIDGNNEFPSISLSEVGNRRFSECCEVLLFIIIKVVYKLEKLQYATWLWFVNDLFDAIRRIIVDNNSKRHFFSRNIKEKIKGMYCYKCCQK